MCSLVALENPVQFGGMAGDQPCMRVGVVKVAGWCGAADTCLLGGKRPQTDTGSFRGRGGYYRIHKHIYEKREREKVGGRHPSHSHDPILVRLNNYTLKLNDLERKLRTDIDIGQAPPPAPFRTTTTSLLARRGALQTVVLD